MWDFRPQECFQLRNKISGEEKRLTHTESQLLLLLLSNKHRVVTKSEIHKKIWLGKCVSDASITHSIASLRLALNDTAEAQCIIRTVPKAGYFVAENKIALALTNQDQSYTGRPDKIRALKLRCSWQVGVILLLVSMNLLLFWFLFIPSQSEPKLNMSRLNSQTNTFTIKNNDFHSQQLLEQLIRHPDLNNVNFYITSNKTRIYVSCIHQNSSSPYGQSINFSIDIKRAIERTSNDIVQKCQ
ncbi:transcriptional regulator [Vibrio splendidus]|uniref:Transcriptional regulator n=3 Tax=Vibrio TaxID=662 RepID=A0A2N7NPV9_9VIBR|nr:MULTISPECIES: winged helix-turn-helix domain-containing protein [Vibrio]MCC4788050.1 winged helix-turn-helix domain-containing protein [Vibrio splendidus]MDH5934284.1 winged helix-turn-helix domain-containing protein [Vibrio splendidus]MDP2500204.1 winged helix-turn-helix domain-containing protein [Vibrio splendidus]MDP2592774.1 winged helix-turn-helix domain-containing protein [Vibrio splendidus]OEE54011.1 transcriptional regulator [Vibrio splendidus FF-500]